MMLNTFYLAHITVVLIEGSLICIGNTFTIFVFWNQRQSLKGACYLLLNLSVADLLVGVSEMTVIVAETIPRRKLSHSDGEVITVIASPISNVSVFTLVVISLERACAVVWPFRHRTAGNRVYIISIIAIWIAGFCLVSVNLLVLHGLIGELATFLALTSTIFIALCVVLASYMKIRAKLRRSAPINADQESHDRKFIERNIKLSKILFIVIGLSFLFWMPAVTIYCIFPFCKNCIPQTELVVSVITALHMANSLVNPIVYSFRMPIFKTAMKKLLKKGG